jgi:WD40 repeat protein
VFETATGKTVKQFVMDKYEAPANNPQTIMVIAASPDGRLFTATTEPVATAWVWDVKTGQKITSYRAEKIISGLSFSPDSSLLVMGILVRSSIYIWKIPQGP